ncbi:hypothetical protein FQR65_LT20350 [Abscondita terminalis]|nr:hypothetical protein FQR65_LT20350 [Abscondita terminalis]
MGSLRRERPVRSKAAGLNRVTVSLGWLDDAVFRSNESDVDFPVSDVAVPASRRPRPAGPDRSQGQHGGQARHQRRPDPAHGPLLPGHGRDAALHRIHGRGCDQRLAHGRGCCPPTRYLARLRDRTCPWCRPGARLPWRDPPCAGAMPDAAGTPPADPSLGEVGVISSVTHAFCGDCNRARLSTEGRLYLCLFASEGWDLRSLLRGGASDGGGAAAHGPHLAAAQVNRYFVRVARPAAGSHLRARACAWEALNKGLLALSRPTHGSAMPLARLAPQVGPLLLPKPPMADIYAALGDRHGAPVLADAGSPTSGPAGRFPERAGTICRTPWLACGNPATRPCFPLDPGGRVWVRPRCGAARGPICVVVPWMGALA